MADVRTVHTRFIVSPAAGRLSCVAHTHTSVDAVKYVLFFFSFFFFQLTTAWVQVFKKSL